MNSRHAWCTALLALCAPAVAHETAQVCFNYGCSTRAEVRFAEGDLRVLGAEFDEVSSAEEELAAVSRAIGRLYALAAQSTPIGYDRGENVFDDGVDGSMDCIDHSTNTTTFLGIADRRGWLRFHGPSERERRGWFLTVHWTATLVERGGSARYAVDSWFFAPGEAAFVHPLAKWQDGARPAKRYLGPVSE